jgi:hypothetical protein
VFFPIILRILFGDLPVSAVVAVYYTYKGVLTLIVTLLTLKIALKTAFLWDFNTMSGSSNSSRLVVVIGPTSNP